MASGIRATVRFTDIESCPIARVSRDAASPITQVSTSVTSDDGRASVTEFIADLDDAPADPAVERVFSYGPADLYRTTHDREAACPCECLGEFGCPVHRYEAADGDLTLVFHAESFEQLQDVMAALRERFPSADVQRLLQPPLEGVPEERVFVNRGTLTDRQREVLEAAYEMGYFERPKRANATEIAETLGISQSTFTEHLVAAQRKILDDVLD